MGKVKIKLDPARELAERMVAALENQRGRGRDSYPLTVDRLAQLTEPKAPPQVLLKAIKKKKGFLDKVVVARRGDIHSPLALADDLHSLAESPLVMEFLLRSARNSTNQAFSIAQLKSKASGALKEAFAAAQGRIEQNRLPASIAWILVNRTRKLFFMEDLHRGNQPSSKPSGDAYAHDGKTAPRHLELPGTPGDFPKAFDDAFEKLNRQEGSLNFVSLVDLRRALAAFPRSAFDVELKKLWSQGRYSLRAAEGRFGIRPEEREAGFLQEGALLLFVSPNA